MKKIGLNFVTCEQSLPLFVSTIEVVLKYKEVCTVGPVYNEFDYIEQNHWQNH